MNKTATEQALLDEYANLDHQKLWERRRKKYADFLKATMDRALELAGKFDLTPQEPSAVEEEQ